VSLQQTINKSFYQRTLQVKEPNTKVVYEKLAFEMLTRANNYEKWKRDVKEYLSSKGLWGVASGQVKKPGAAKKDNAELCIWTEKAERAGDGDGHAQAGED